jgi:hypothetical protein
LLYRFPHGLTATVIDIYRRPYANPVKGLAGDELIPDFTKQTDIVGWVWCQNEAGQEGWVPQNWLRRENDVWRLVRDFDAIELTVTPGQIVELHFSESGFCWVSLPTGEAGWVPDAVLALQS